MSRADELRAQLAAAEAEEESLSALEQARNYFRQNPDDPEAKAAAQAASLAVRAARGAHRALRDIGPAREFLQAAEKAFAEDAAPEKGAAVQAARRAVARMEALLPDGDTGVDAAVRPTLAGVGSTVERV